MRVLFCGHNMSKGFEYTREALAGDEGIEVVHCQSADVSSHVEEATLLVPLMTRLTGDVLQKAVHAKLILQYGVGLEGVDIPAATELGIYVQNIPSRMTGNALSCAEMAIYLALCLLRDQRAMQQSIQSRTLGSPCGDTLFGKHAVVVGYGGIAQELIPRLHALGVKVSCVRSNAHYWKTTTPRTPAQQQQPTAVQQHSNDGRCGNANGHSTEQFQLQQGVPQGVAQGPLQGPAVVQDPSQLLVARGGQDDLPEFVRDADFLVMTCPQTEATVRMVNAKLLHHCKTGVLIINVARGGLLDYHSVLDGLQSGKIGGLGLDVQWQEPFDPNDPIAQHPKVVLTPHIAGVTELSYRSMAEVVADEARRLKRGQGPSRPLNEPAKPRCVHVGP